MFQRAGASESEVAVSHERVVPMRSALARVRLGDCITSWDEADCDHLSTMSIEVPDVKREK